MGQGSSQPVNPGLDGPEDPEDILSTTQNPYSPTTVGKKAKSELQVEGTPVPKRKRKSSINDTNNYSKSAIASVPSPGDKEDIRPLKRKKVLEPSLKTKEGRKVEDRKADKGPAKENVASTKNSLDARPLEVKKASVEAPEDARVSDNLKRSNGPSSKQPSKSKVSSTQKGEQNDIPTSPQNKKALKPSSTTPEIPSTESPRDQTDEPDSTLGRGHRIGKKEKLVGFFTAQEVQSLEAFKLEFCNKHGLSSDEFDRMVQHVDRRKDSGWPCDESIITKPQFWKDIYEVIPDRDRRSVYRFMRRHFQDSTQKPHQWTHEQDDELIQLQQQYGPRFAHIAKILGRGEDDVVQRWKNRLEHRNTMKRGPWSEEEVRGLIDALQASWHALKKAGQDVGQDIYEMDEPLISWGQVSIKLQNCRSRQQCADKWRKIRRKVMGQRTNGNPDAVFDPAAETKPQTVRAKSVTLAEQMEMERTKTFKSSEYVDSDDGEEEENDDEASIAPQPSKKPGNQNTPAKKQKPEPTIKKSTILDSQEKKPAVSTKKAIQESTSSDESQSESDSDSDSGSGTTSKSNSESKSTSPNSESEAESESGSESDSDSGSDSKSDTSVEPRKILQTTKEQEASTVNKKDSSKKGQPIDKSKPKNLLNAQDPARDDSKTKSMAPGGQHKERPEATSKKDIKSKEHGSVSSPTKPGKATPKISASEEQKSSLQKRKLSQSESESESESESDSSSESEASESSRSIPSHRRVLTKAVLKSSTLAQEARTNAKVSGKKEDDHEQSSSESSDASSHNDSSQDSEESDDENTESETDSSDDESKSVNSRNAKRKAEDVSVRNEKPDPKRVKVKKELTRDASTEPSSSSDSSSEASESENESKKNDSGSESESTSESESESESGSESELDLRPKSKSKPDTSRRVTPGGQKSQTKNRQNSPSSTSSPSSSSSRNIKNESESLSEPETKPRPLPAKSTASRVNEEKQKTKSKPPVTPTMQVKKSRKLTANVYRLHD